jgi:hypothetical protein
MSIHVINWSPDSSEIIRSQIKKYFVEDIKFKTIYDNFGGVRVSSTHPFAHLVNTEINGITYDGNLFPSLTIVVTSDRKNPEINTPTIVKDIKINAAEVADIVANRNNYIISDADVASLQSLTANDAYVYSNGTQQERRADFVIEVWSENDKVKGSIYDVLINFLTGYRRFTIKENYDIVIVEDSITGERDGNYNFDFGKMLYGSIIRFNVDYTVAQYYVDDEIIELNTVVHTVEEINPDEE